MADNLRFPIEFDLKSAVDKAASEWDSKYANQLEKAIQRRALEVKLKVNASSLNSLDAVKERLAKLKIEPITPETKAAIKELAAELQALARALEAVKKYSARVGGTPEAVRNSKIALNEQKRAVELEKARRHAAKAALDEEKLRQARERSAAAALRSAGATRSANKEYQNQSSYLERLTQRMAAYWSVHQVGNFITNVRRVTAEFELQRISLGAIIQSQDKANLLFSEIKSFALTSPVSILDLTKYTKQLAAYKIGYNELFETTKRLTDVSVGLGVSMDRIVLLYGQIRATGYLRASEVRQATEAGIPLVEELAKKLTDMNGELVRAADVMDMISKREIGFDLVKEVFEDMTDKGGAFYNMQIKQGNTLYGMWAKLGDAASVMYDQIGNTDSVNAGMKWLIESLTDLMRNWRTWGNMLKWVGGIYLIVASSMKIARWASFALTEAGKKQIATTEANVVAQQKNVMATREAGFLTKWSARISLMHAHAQRQAAMATNVFIKSWYSLKAAFLSNPLGWVITAVTTLTALLYDADDSAKQFASRMGEINEKFRINQARDAQNFTKLANIATNENNEGTTKQKETLEELERTYGEALGQENLQIEALKSMNGEYSKAIALIEEYNTKMKYTEREGAIKEFYGQRKKDAFADLEDELATIGFGAEELGHSEAQKILFDIQSSMLDALEEGKDISADMFKEEFVKQAKEVFKAKGKSDSKAEEWATVIYARASGEVEDWVASIKDERRELDENNKKRDEDIAKLNQYAGAVKETTEALKQNQDSLKSPAVAEYNALIHKQVDAVKAKVEEISRIKVKSNLAPEVVAEIDEIIKKTDDPQLKAALATLRDALRDAVPTDDTVVVWREQFTKSFEAFVKQTPALKNSAKKLNQYMMKNGETLTEYGKRIKGVCDSLKEKIKELKKTIAVTTSVGIAAKLMQELKNNEALLKFLEQFASPSTSSGRSKSDSRLQTLQEIANKMAEVNKEYDELLKKEGQTKALADTQKLFAASFRQMQDVAREYKFKLPAFEVPKTIEDVQKWYMAIQNEIKRLDLKNADKVLIELGFKSDKAAIDKTQKDIEAQIKELADRISRTKTAKEFYDKILGMTGDVELAAKVSVAIYGDDGFDLQKRLSEQIRGYFQNERINVEIPVDVIGDNDYINYKRLGEFANAMKEQLGEEPYKAVKKIAEDGQKDIAKTWESYFKDIEKAESYASKRVELAQTTADKIAKIRADMAANPELRKSGEGLIAGLMEKEMKEAAKLEWNAFKGTPLYVQMFEDLEQASTSTLEMMKSRLEGMSHIWGSALDPTQLKEIQGRINEITEQLRERNPWKVLKEAYAQYKEATDNVTMTGAVKNVGEASKNFHEASGTYGADSIQAKAAEQELKARKKIVEIVREITAEQGKQVKGQKALALAQQKAFDKESAARTELEIANAKLTAVIKDAKERGVNPATDPGVIAAQERVKAAEAELELTEKVSDILVENAKKSKTLKESFASAAQTVTMGMQAASDIAKAVADTMEALGSDEIDVQFWNDISEALGDLTAGFQGIIDSVLALNVGGIISNAIGVIPNMVKGFVGLFSAGKVRKANKEIRRQQELLERLEYTYSRLEKAAEKAFGGDYIANFKRQQKVLEAQARAYQAQAAAERSKGKAADKDKIKEYENAYRDTMDEIADMQGQIAAQMLGSDLTSAARDFAKAWIDAYKEFGNTTDAMSEKFHEMIENMVVEGAMSKVMERALRPMFDMIDNMEDTDFYSESFWRNVVATAEQGAKDADYGAQTMMKFLEQAGISMRELGGDYTGMAKEVASASSEEINAATAALNTQNYYVSHLPTIGADVAAIRMMMEAGSGASLNAAAGTGIDRETWQREAFDRFAAMERYMAETVNECKRIASECREQTATIKKVISHRGSGPSAFQLNVRM